MPRGVTDNFWEILFDWVNPYKLVTERKCPIIADHKGLRSYTMFLGVNTLAGGYKDTILFNPHSQ